jgi:membrane protease YdiL (CAAX protease family)
MPPDPIDTTPAEPGMEAPFIEGSAPPLTLESPALPITREPFWGYLDLLLIIGFIFAGMICTAVLHIVLVSPNLRSQPVPLDLWLQFAFYGIVYLGFLTVYKLRYRVPVMISLGWRHAGWNPLFAALGGIALAVGLAVLAPLLHTPKVETPMDKLVSSSSSFALFAITAVIIAPFFEELLFRGFVQPLLSRTFGVIAGVLITAGLFGVAHAPEYSWAWQYALIISLAGATFGWIRARTNSIVPGTVMHGFYNLAFVIGYLATTHGMFR